MSGDIDAFLRDRRTFNASVVAALMATLLPTTARAQSKSTKPRAGQRLAFANGDRAGKELTPADLVLHRDPVLAYPMEPGGAVIESRAGMVALMRIPESALSDEVKAHAPKGIVAFSAVCTHYGCPVSSTDPTGTQIICNCHGSTFDAGKRGAVVKGPATRRLAMLPLKLEGDTIVVSAGFDGPIGPPTT